MNLYRVAIVGLLVALMVTACVVESTPDTPGNVAIRLPAALRSGESEQISPLLCSTIAEGNEADITDPASLGELADFYEAVLRNWTEERGAFGGNSQYSATEEVDLEVDDAWTEIEFRGEDESEIWRVHMVRENGAWRACSAELRQ